MNNPLKIAFSAGELSGDEHMARVIEAVRELQPDAQFQGMGGRNCRGAGATTVVDSETAASVMGFVEVLAALPRIWRAFKTLEALFDSWRPDVLIVVDFADFNMRLIAAARRRGIRTVYFIPPQVWAWRAGRVRALDRTADILATIFPFEVDFYRRNGCNKAVFVGHPFVSEIKLGSENRREIINKLGLSVTDPIVVVLPGSRSSELQRHGSVVMRALDLMHSEMPAVQAIIVVAPTRNPRDFDAYVAARPWVRVVHGDSLTYLSIGDVGLLKSGTSNLQAAFCGLPFLMFYRTNPVSAWLVRTWIRTRNFSIVNIIRDRSVSELLQEHCNPETIAAEGCEMLKNRSKNDEIRKALREVVAALTTADDKSAYQNIAAHVCALLGRAPSKNSP